MIKTTIQGIPLELETEEKLFSPTHVDEGTRFMIAEAAIGPEDKVLDLGCGYGVVGIFAAKIAGEENVFLTDISQEAVRLSKENAARNGVPGVRIVQSDGFLNLRESGFTKILSNPPYHANFSVPKHFIEKGFNRLQIGGKMFMVTKRREWYKNKFIAIFGGVSIREQEGYFVFCAEKRSAKYAGLDAKKQKKKK